MKKNKQKKIKSVKPGVIKYVNEDTNQIKKFVYILIGLVVISCLLYILTAKYLVKDAFQTPTDEVKNVTITYDKVNVGEVFNRPYDEYYVYAYKTEDNKSTQYEYLKSRYTGKTKIYTLDLSVEINAKSIGEKGNKDATTANELSLVEPTLILIKDGKILKYYEGYDSIKEILK